MLQLWNDMNLYIKYSALIMLFSILFFVLLFVREYLKMTDKDYAYTHPSFWSVMTIFCFISLDGIFSLVFISFEINVLLAEVLGAISAISLTPLCFLLSKYISKIVRKVGVVYNEQFVNCTGIAISKLDNSGGSVCVNYKNRYIDAKAISKNDIQNGERIIVIGISNGNLICKRINPHGF